jgi:hypothetical protein
MFNTLRIKLKKWCQHQFASPRYYITYHDNQYFVYEVNCGNSEQINHFRTIQECEDYIKQEVRYRKQEESLAYEAFGLIYDADGNRISLEKTKEPVATDSPPKPS